MTSYVCGFYVAATDGHVVLILKDHPEWQKGKYNGVGGKLQPDECAVDAMVREFHEETGVRTEAGQWQATVIMAGADHTVYFFRLLSDRGLFAFPDVGLEQEQPTWISLDHLPANLIPNLRWLLPLSLDPDVRFPLFVDDKSLDPVRPGGC